MGKARRVQIGMACARVAAPPPTTILDVPDKLLELVLLRVRTPVCLFRAAATCKRWRRVIAGAGFLHRFRGLHGPHLLLGHYCINTVKTENGARELSAEFVPSPWRPAEHLRQRLSLDDFLRRPATVGYSHQRVLTDSRGGLLAFVRDNWYAVVCDPWNRQYLELDFPWRHPRPESEEERFIREDECVYHSLGAYLLDVDGGGSPMSSFRLLCVWLVKNYMDDTVSAHSCVYSATGRRRWLQPSGGKNVGREHWTGTWGVMDPQGEYTKRFLGRAGGSILWSGYDGHVLVLDESTGEFCIFSLPAVDVNNRVSELYDSRDLLVVGGGAAGPLRILRMVDGDQLEVFSLTHGAIECTVERRVGLCQLANIEASPGLSWIFLDNGATASTTHVVFGVFVSPSATEKVFSLDIETMKLQRMKNSTALLRAERVFPYELPWTQTTISVCL